MLLRVVICLLISTASQGCITGTSPSGATCPTWCKTCDDTLLCSSCCWSYYVNSLGVCQRCDDLQCGQCTLLTPSSTTCNICHNNYALTGSNPNTCTICSNTTAAKCWTVNNCNSTSSCLDCRNFYAVVKDQCAMCN